MLWAMLIACTTSERPAPSIAPRPLAEVRTALAFPGEVGDAPADWRPARALEGYRAQPVGLDVRPGFRTGAVYYQPDSPAGDGAVLVAHGHFGAGKSSAEAQEIAHRLAARGTPVLVVDNPGMEEWSGQGRELHFEAGAHNRALLHAAGTSAMGLQIASLEAGLDFLEGQGARSVVATGASGGAVQAFWLALVDERVVGVALAAVPPVPREVRASGCPCDQVPGIPGPDPSTVAALAVPSLWLKEVQGPPLEGLPRDAEWSVHEGPHSYTEAMQREAIPWIEERLGHEGVGWLPAPPSADLRSAGPHEARPHRQLTELLGDPEARWTPDPWPSVAYELGCSGEGPVVLLGGEGTAAALGEDRRALREAGFETCRVTVPSDETGMAAAFGRGQVYADRYAGALAAAASAKGAVGVYAVRAWGLPASAVDLPFVVRDPVRVPGDLDEALDPPWVHIPGAWWGSTELALQGAIAAGEDPSTLAAALAGSLRVEAVVDKAGSVP